MNFRRMATALLIGLLISGTCTFLLSRALRSRSNTKVPELSYVAPLRPLAAGETIKAESLQMVTWPASQPIPDGFVKPDTLIGRGVLYPIDKGQPITEKFLSAAGSGAGLASKIPDGMRAVALRSDDIVGVAGFLMPGSHVDVLASLQVKTKDETVPVTVTILQNAEVVTTGHQIQPDPEGKPATVNVVTLLLTPEDAERAVFATQQGPIHFVLRSGTDKLQADTGAPIQLASLVGGGLKSDLNGSAKPAAPRPHPAPVHVAEPPASLTVETVSGDHSTTDTFRIGSR
ncbi:pilus assembly protein CpaB [Bryocella elongata]|uniref:Pilus assembly protein CpaB n=1 Tax=Bryocella elongata TaxID=863522 RepID=A0A1H6AXC8_9BACT|nr:Flp pilus assembly protein CpaB [Bryocella elongata]SEG52737.1 pilus assembly protein CpaB [Bryocella elongata]